MSRFNTTMTVSALVLTGLCSVPAEVMAVDPPHNGRNSAGLVMSCNNCHYDTSGPTPSWVTQVTLSDPDATYLNNLCTSCHIVGKMSDSRYIVKTHSSSNTSSQYGTWSIECRTCHNPHYQEQVSSYRSDVSADLVTGTIGPFSQPSISAAETTIPIVGGGLAPNEWIDHVFIPNKTYPTRLFRIKSNTADTVTVHGPVNNNYAAPGSIFAIRLGKMVVGQVEIRDDVQRQVKFFRESGARSFGTSTGPADMASICQVCHEHTISFNNGGTLEGPGHPAAQAGGNCTQCHTHASGFKPECGSCHGNPPTVNTPGGPNGLASNDGGTGATTPGAHGKHVISAGIACDSCHENGMPETTIYDKLIQIGFNIANGAYRTGSYDGRVSLANGYTYTRGNPGTTVASGGTKVCANVYCHGSTMAPNAGTDITPAWDVPASGACGACHGATVSSTPTRGSHYKHSRTDLLGYAYPCATCHKDPAADASLHVNGISEVALSGLSASGGSYTGTPAMLDAYGTCTNVYCHSTVQSSPPGGPPVYRVTPVWGDELWSCGACHEYGTNLATGSHGKHMQQPELTECWACHNYNMLDDGCMACHDADSIEPQRDRHANHSIDVAFAPMYGGSYSGTPQPDTPYGMCSNIYCHSTVQGDPDPLQPPTYATPTWGQSVSGVCAMGACHPVGNAHPTDSGYVPLTTGSHAKHLQYRFDQDGNCQSCHYDASYGGCIACHNRTLDHANRSIDVVFKPDFPSAAGGASGVYSGDAVPRTAYGSCSDLYCHSPGTAGAPPYTAPNVTAYAWGGGMLPSDCTGCHNGDKDTAQVMTTGSHGMHVQGCGTDCSVCHAQTASNSRTLNPAVYNGNLTMGYRNHANGWISVAFPAAVATSGTYASQASPVNMKVPGSPYGACGSTFCHSTGTSLATGVIPSQASPVWGSTGPLSCNSCHGSEAGNDGTGRPWYDNGMPKANSHRRASHVDSPCSDCHYGTTKDGTTIANRASHANGTYDVVPNGSAGISFTYDFNAGGGVCSSVSCHAGNAPGIWGQ